MSLNLEDTLLHYLPFILETATIGCFARAPLRFLYAKLAGVLEYISWRSLYTLLSQMILVVFEAMEIDSVFIRKEGLLSILHVSPA